MSDAEEAGKESALRKNYQRNRAYSKDGEYTTALNPESERKFREWVRASRPFERRSGSSGEFALVPNKKLCERD